TAGSWVISSRSVATATTDAASCSTGASRSIPRWRRWPRARERKPRELARTAAGAAGAVPGVQAGRRGGEGRAGRGAGRGRVLVGRAADRLADGVGPVLCVRAGLRGPADRRGDGALEPGETGDRQGGRRGGRRGHRTQRIPEGRAGAWATAARAASGADPGRRNAAGGHAGLISAGALGRGGAPPVAARAACRRTGACRGAGAHRCRLRRRGASSATGRRRTRA